MFSNIRIALVNTTHPGNIGATARAMKTMGLQNLYLVNPKKFPDVNATALAAGADNILANAVVTSSLKEALTGSEIVFGTSARLRALQLPTSDPKTAAKFIIDKSKTNIISIVFGRESNGLSNEELELCNQHLHIPTNPDFNSLNIAAAVQLIVYELNMTMQNERDSTDRVKPSLGSDPCALLATNEEVRLFYQHLEQTLLEIKFLRPSNHHKLMPKLKRMFNRTQLEKPEINILRGILTSVNNAIESGLKM